MIFILLLLASFSVSADPWVVYGQSVVNYPGLDNPEPSHAGLIGEVMALPYQVPEGKTLRIDGIAIESHTTAIESRPVYVLFPWITDEPVQGDAPTRIAGALLSCTGSTSTVSCPTRYYVPSGKWVNIRIICQSPSMSGTRMGWHLFGELE